MSSRLRSGASNRSSCRDSACCRGCAGSPPRVSPSKTSGALATWHAGAVLGMPMLGELVAGAPADLLVFRRDPTHNLDELDKLDAVIAGGRLYRRRDLDGAREAWSRLFDGPVFDTISMPLARLDARA